MVPHSILDLHPLSKGAPRASRWNARDLARHAERWGYRRYWLAEHHNMPGIASAATAVAIGYVAGGTRTIRVGAGGMMLTNHAPLVIAEQFGTLESLFPGRIDLGLGRAPGTDPVTARALRRGQTNSADTFPAGCHGTGGLFSACEGRTSRAGRSPARASSVPIGYRARACSARSSPPRWVCLSPLHHISRPMPSWTRSNFTGALFVAVRRA